MHIQKFKQCINVGDVLGAILIMETMLKDTRFGARCEKEKMLYAASSEGCTPLVELLLTKEVDLEYKHINGSFTALCVASTYGHAEVVELLLDAGANVHNDAQGRKTPLHFAARYGHLKVAQTLIRYGGDVNKKDFLLRTPLHLCQSQDVIDLLIKCGANTH